MRQKSKLFGKLAREITVSAKIGTARSGHECAAARRDHRGARREHAEGQYRARHQEGDRQRRRELRADSLRGLRPGRRRGHRRGADRQPQSHRGRGARDLHQERRQSRRDRRGVVHVRSCRRHRIRRQGRQRRSDVRGGARGRRRRRGLERRRRTRSMPRRIISARSPRRSKRNSASRARHRWCGGRKIPWRSTTSRAKR